MPPIELHPLQPARAHEAGLRPARAAQSAALRSPAGPAVDVAHSRLLEAGEAPVDGARVDRIRRALEQGQYRISADRIADALIAASALLEIDR